ncbi:MAG: phosphopantothenoylcysteine decarboxylase [Planctomycetes bacterium]|nr:phosphopantothenoylcysteine decarboxylase [Planctomycetota bacterium]
MKPKAVLGVGGGIAAYKVAFVASRLVQKGVDVRVAMTPSSLSFVGPSTFGGLTGSQPILSPTQVDRDGSVPHIDAARGAGVYCIAPATAGMLAQLAAGAADDPVALLATTVPCPIVICPAMNDAMWQRPVVQQNVAKLRSRGVETLGPVEGHLAEGYDAIGRMVEPDAILERLLAILGVA